MPGKSASFNDWKVIGIRVYYADGTTRSTQHDNLEALPRSGIIAINFYYDQTYESGDGRVFRYKDTVAGDDFYFINPQNWREYDGVRRLHEARGAGAILFEGVEIEKADFLRIYNAAYQDRQF